MSVSTDRRWDFRAIAVLGVLGWLIAMLVLGGTLSATFAFLLISFLLFYLPGNLIIGHHWRTVSSASVVLLTVVGLAVSVTLFAVLRVVATDVAVLSTFAVLALGGFLRLVGAIRASSLFAEPNHRQSECAATLAGILVMFVVGSAFWPSGASSTSGISFYGPMARDHVFHLALIERLVWHVPPDNFLVADTPFPAYHFLPDLTQVLLRRVSLGAIPSLDIYYRLYPSLIYFCLGYIAFWVCSRLTASLLGGGLGVVLVVFGADFSWIPRCAGPGKWRRSISGFATLVRTMVQLE